MNPATIQERLQSLVEQAEQTIARFADGSPTSRELMSGISRLGDTAAADPAVALVRVRKTLQFIVESAFERQFDEAAGTRPLENLLQRLVKEGAIPKRLAAYGNLVRDLGNVGAHQIDEPVTIADVLAALEQLLPLLRWHAEQCGGHQSIGLQSVENATLPSNPPATSEPRKVLVRPETRRRWTLIASAIVAVGISLTAWVGWRAPWPSNPEAQASPPSRLPVWAKDIEAARVLRMVYDGVPPAHPAEGMLAVRLELRFRRDRKGSWQPLADGEALSAADDYQFTFETNQAGYVYLFQVDSQGKLTVLHPALPGCENSEGANPVTAGNAVSVPAVGSLFLDEQLGTEHVYSVFSTARWPALEAALPLREAGSASRRVQEPFRLALRGVGGKLPESAAAPQVVDLPVQRRDAEFFAEHASMLVVERWFQHTAPARER